MTQEIRFEDRSVRVRVPVVASYAFQLINQFLPLHGLPLDIKSEGFGVGADAAGRRFQTNRARLHFPGMSLVALVRSWEHVPTTLEGQKSLQHLTIEFRDRSMLPLPNWYKVFTQAWGEATAISLLTPTAKGNKLCLELGLAELDRLSSPIFIP